MNSTTSAVEFTLARPKGGRFTMMHVSGFGETDENFRDRLDKTDELLDLFDPIYHRHLRGRMGGMIGFIVFALAFCLASFVWREGFLASLNMTYVILVFLASTALGWFLGRPVGRLIDREDGLSAERKLLEIIRRDADSRMLLSELWDDDEPDKQALAKRLLKRCEIQRAEEKAKWNNIGRTC